MVFVLILVLLLLLFHCYISLLFLLLIVLCLYMSGNFFLPECCASELISPWYLFPLWLSMLFTMGFFFVFPLAFLFCSFLYVICMCSFEVMLLFRNFERASGFRLIYFVILVCPFFLVRSFSLYACFLVLTFFSPFYCRCWLLINFLPGGDRLICVFAHDDFFINGSMFSALTAIYFSWCISLLFPSKAFAVF